MPEAPSRGANEKSSRWWLARRIRALAVAAIAHARRELRRCYAWLATWSRQRWLVLGICALATAALIYCDGELRERYQAGIPNPPDLRALGNTLTKALHPGLVLLMVSAACLAMWHRWGEMAKAICAGVVTQTIGIAALKDLIGRKRPDAQDWGDPADPWQFSGPEWGSHSMPSGHAALAFVLAAILSGFYPRARWVFYPLAVAIALARVHLDRHFLSDVFVAAVFGILVGQWAVWRFRGEPEPVPEPETAPAASAEAQEKSVERLP